MMEARFDLAELCNRLDSSPVSDWQGAWQGKHANDSYSLSLDGIEYRLEKSKYIKFKSGGFTGRSIVRGIPYVKLDVYQGGELLASFSQHNREKAGIDGLRALIALYTKIAGAKKQEHIITEGPKVLAYLRNLACEISSKPKDD